MFFHIDESGNTGNSLFDANQPRLSYGLLSSKRNVDLLGDRLHRRMIDKVGMKELHANDLGVAKLTPIVPDLYALHRKMQFEFGYYFIEKPTFALVMLFEAVFDAGLNSAVPWVSYWTPMRFLLINALHSLVDRRLLEQAWALCTVRRQSIARRADDIVALLTTLDVRASSRIQDARMREITRDALAYGIKDPLKLDFGTPDPNLIAPNVVCFQFVLHGIASFRRRKGQKRPAKVTVDQQGQYNGSQEQARWTLSSIAEGFRRARMEDRRLLLNQPMMRHLDEQAILHQGMPNGELNVADGYPPIGIQLVDVYLWVCNRVRNRQPLSPELRDFGVWLLKQSSFDGIGMDTLRMRWEQFERELPAIHEMEPEQVSFAVKTREEHRERVKAMKIGR